MPKQLIISGNDNKKQPEIQLAQINGDLATTARFINSSQSNEIFSFPINITSNLTVTNTNLVQIPPFVIQFDSTSDYVLFNIDLCVSATADLFIDIQIDGSSVLAKPFLLSGTNKQLVDISRIFTLGAGSHTVRVLWRVSGGTGTMYSAGNNFIQAFNFY